MLLRVSTSAAYDRARLRALQCCTTLSLAAHTAQVDTPKHTTLPRVLQRAPAVHSCFPGEEAITYDIRPCDPTLNLILCLT